MNLQEIGRKNFTEKVGHGYLPIYERLWNHLQYEPIILLEIGIYNGNSMRTWCEWFPNATIVGIDYNPNNPMKTDRANLHFGEQEDTAFLWEIANAYREFDIIIDDGSHKWSDQQISFEFLWPYVKSGGMYIIEDLHVSDDPEWAKGNISTMDYLLTLVKCMFLGLDAIDVKSIECYPKFVVFRK